MSERIPGAWKERLASPLTWHYAGAAMLLALVIPLGIRFGLDWAATSGSSADAMAAKQVQLTALRLQTEPLHGLDKRVDAARAQVGAFYEKRIPPNYSSISARLGDLAVQSNVRLSQMQYTQGRPGQSLTEISVDAGISGEYPAIMHFINSLERDQTFFLIRAMALTGQQGGLVNLRLRVSTWLRPADAAASGLPETPQADASGDASGSGGE